MLSVLELYANATTIDSSPEPEPGILPQSRPLASPPRRSKVSDIKLRAAGAVLIGIAVGSIRWLTTLMHTDAGHALTPFGFLIGLIGVVTGCLGSILLWHGTHIYDQCEVSQRWRRY